MTDLDELERLLMDARQCGEWHDFYQAMKRSADEHIRNERRLARLERMFRVMSPNIDGNHAWTFTGSPTLRGPNLRAAIDAAIAQEQP